jgi:16S rRNA (uracil1498-N3)-methyltransferase
MVTLPEDEAAHLVRVLRLKRGDAVRVFDGRGHEWRAEVAETGKKGATLRLLRRVTAAAEGGVPITLAMAVLKSDKMDDVVRDAVMLGAAGLIPLITERTEVSRGTVERGRRTERWQRVAVASAKQCGRAVVPAIAEAAVFADWIVRPAGEPLIILVEPGAEVMMLPIRRLMRPARATIAIGPEGGWTPGEIAAAAKAGAAPITLGALTLRADAAPTVALAAFRTIWEDF